MCRHCRHCISFWKLQVWPRSCRSYPLQHRWDEKLPKLLIDRKVRLVRKLLQLDSMGTLPLSVRMKWSHGRPDMNFNLCCMLQYYRVVQLVRFQVAFLFCSVLLLKGKWVGHSCKLCWMHTSSAERLSENFEDKAVTYIIFFVGTHWFWKCIFWKISLGPFWGRQGCQGQTT